MNSCDYVMLILYKLIICAFIHLVKYNGMRWMRYWKIKIRGSLVRWHDESKMIGQWLKCEIVWVLKW
jgi:hypothetical protein